MPTACLVLHLPSAGAAAVDVDAYLATARSRFGEDLRAAVRLDDPDGDRPVVLVAATGRHDDLRRFAGDFDGAGWISIVAGADASLFGDGPPGWIQLVVDPVEAPVPFDDPAVVGVFQDQLGWYLPLLGPHHLSCAALFHDGVRAAGSLVAFSAADAPEARWLAAADPWRRLGRGWLRHLPAGVLRPGPTPAGPGIQRYGTFSCAPRSMAEPDTDQR